MRPDVDIPRDAVQGPAAGGPAPRSSSPDPHGRTARDDHRLSATRCVRPVHPVACPDRHARSARVVPERSPQGIRIAAHDRLVDGSGDALFRRLRPIELRSCHSSCSSPDSSSRVPVPRLARATGTIPLAGRALCPGRLHRTVSGPSRRSRRSSPRVGKPAVSPSAAATAAPHATAHPSAASMSSPSSRAAM